jgi:hypothetical protein
VTRAKLTSCASCGTAPIAWSSPRVEYCYACLPGGPFQPPPCVKCGSRDYFSGGLCRSCHYLGQPPDAGSCPDCYAWGTRRRFGWICLPCRGWRPRFNIGTCIACSRELAVNEQGACRLCWSEAVRLYATDSAESVIAANLAGQQLHFAIASAHNTRRHPPKAHAPSSEAAIRQLQPEQLAQQLILFDGTRDLSSIRRDDLPAPADPSLAAYLMDAVTSHASRFGWTEKTAARCRSGIRIVLSLQEAPGLRIRASDILALKQVEDVPVRAVLDVCDEAGVLDEDRLPTVVSWFEKQIAGLPEPMTSELRIWLRVMRRGSATPPRRRPRSDTTTRLHLRWAMPALQTWAAQGHESLREISNNDIKAILPASGNPRATLGNGLRSIFIILKTEKVTFTNPIARFRLGSYETTYPLPAKVAAVRAALESPNPAAALMAGLLAFHGLQARELRGIKVTDIRDGRLHLADRVVPLAGPVRVRLTAYLNHRQQTWPNTANLHLFIHRGTAGTLKPYGSRWAQLLLGMSPRVIREDRILHEIHVTGGDVRRVCEMFGYTVSGTMRYLNTLDPPGITSQAEPGRPA